MPPLAIGMGKIEERSVRFKKISSIMIGMGFSESMNSYLTNESYNFDNMLVKKRSDYVKLKDPKGIFADYDENMAAAFSVKMHWALST